MRGDIWVFLFLFGLMLFSWPILGIFKDRMSMYLFISWFVFIGLILITMVLFEKGEGGS